MLALAQLASAFLLLVGTQEGTVAPPVDSVGVLDAARDAQAEFERLRLDHFPTTVGSSGGACDEIVGRFCFWHGGDDDWVSPPEHARVRAGRDRLIVQLDSLARLNPRDDWIAGQRVRYLVEAGRLDTATRVAAECRSAAWWCLALVGYVHHAAQRFAAADSAFAAATAVMSEADRCAWNDLSLVLDAVPSEYRRASCDQRAPLEARIWWLADPLYLVPGNERRTEHHARRVLSRLQEHARSGYAVRWGEDLDELLIRYGWPAGWERDVSGQGVDGGRSAIISHHAPRSREFIPPRQFIVDPTTIGEGAWDIDPDRPRSTYAPPYAQSFGTIEAAQVGVFPRGDAAVVVAAFEMPEEGRGEARRDEGVTTMADDGRRWVTSKAATEGDVGRPGATGVAALVFTPDPFTPAIVSRGEGVGAFRLAVTVPRRPGLVSLEAIVRGDTARAGRARWWLPITEGPGLHISQPLLFDAPVYDSLPGTLEAVFPVLRPAARAVAGERVGVYWETWDWGTEPAPARFLLTVSRVGETWLRRAVRALRLAGRDQSSVSLGWTEALNEAGALHTRSLAVGLPDGPAGIYVLRIEARVGNAVAHAERRLVVEDGGGR